MQHKKSLLCKNSAEISKPMEDCTVYIINTNVTYYFLGLVILRLYLLIWGRATSQYMKPLAVPGSFVKSKHYGLNPVVSCNPTRPFGQNPTAV